MSSLLLLYCVHRELRGPFLCQPSPEYAPSCTAFWSQQGHGPGHGSQAQQSWSRFRLPGQVTSHLCASISSSVTQEKAVASPSEGLVKLVSEALIRLPTFAKANPQRHAF